MRAALGYVKSLLGVSSSKPMLRQLRTSLQDSAGALRELRKNAAVMLKSLDQIERNVRRALESGDPLTDQDRANLLTLISRCAAWRDSSERVINAATAEKLTGQRRAIVEQDPASATYWSESLQRKLLIDASNLEEMNLAMIRMANDVIDMATAALALDDIEQNPSLLVTGAELSDQLEAVRA